MRRIVALVVGLGLALSACVSEPEVVEVTRDVIVTETEYVAVGDGSLETYCSGMADGFIAGAKPHVGPPPDGWRDTAIEQCVDTLDNNMGTIDPAEKT